jgi:hypothetical protein
VKPSSSGNARWMGDAMMRMVRNGA